MLIVELSWCGKYLYGFSVLSLFNSISSEFKLNWSSSFFYCSMIRISPKSYNFRWYPSIKREFTIANIWDYSADSKAPAADFINSCNSYFLFCYRSVFKSYFSMIYSIYFWVFEHSYMIEIHDLMNSAHGSSFSLWNLSLLFF